METGLTGLIRRVDTPEKREARIKELEECGLNREDAVFIDDNVLAIGDVMMATLEKMVTEVSTKKPELALHVYHELVRVMEYTFIEAHQRFHEMIDGDALESILAMVSERDGRVH